MQRRRFGRSGIAVPVIGMGTWKSLNVRGASEESDRTEVVHAAFNAGTNLFDTSPMYGESERVLGSALKDIRAKVLVADKIWTPSVEEGREQAKRALAWYGGMVDIYQVHNLVAVNEQLELLDELKANGQVRVVGATHYKHAAFPELMNVMRSGLIDMIQIPYNVADRVVENEVLPLAQELDLGVLVMEPLGSGALVRTSPPVEALKPLEKYGVHSWAQALLKWILADERVHCVIPATSKRNRAVENAGAGEGLSFDDEARSLVEYLAARG